MLIVFGLALVYDSRLVACVSFSFVGRCRCLIARKVRSSNHNHIEPTKYHSTLHGVCDLSRILKRHGIR